MIITRFLLITVGLILLAGGQSASGTVAHQNYLPMVLNTTNNSPPPTPTPEPPDCDWFPCAYMPTLVVGPDYEYVRIIKNPYNDFIDMTDWILTVENNQSGMEEILFVFPGFYLDTEYEQVMVNPGIGYETPINIYLGYDQPMFYQEVCVRMYNGEGVYLDEVYKPDGYDLDANQDCDQPTPTPTPTITPTPLDVQIIDIVVSTIPSQEYVVITNTGTSEIDMTGWYMQSDGTTADYVFPQSYPIASGHTVNLRTGLGTNSLNNLFWGLSFSLWTSSNCATLYDSHDLEIDMECP